MKNFILLITLVLLPLSVQARKITDDKLILGKPGSSSDIQIKSEDGNNILQVNRAQQTWQFSNDAGANFLDIGSGGGGAGGGINLLTNPNMEQGLTGWTNSGGALTEITGTQALEGQKSLRYTFGGQANYVESATVEIGAGLYGSACEARVFYKDSSPENSIQVLNADDEILAEVPTPEHSIAAYESAFFRCPTEDVVTSTADKGILRLRITQTGTVSTPIDFDVTHLGSTIGLVTIVDAEFEEKILSSDVTTSQTLTEFTFNNLVLGEKYQIGGHIQLSQGAGDGFIDIENGSQQVGRLLMRGATSSDDVGANHAINLIFTATDTTLTFSYTQGINFNSVRGNGTKEESFVQLRRVVERQVYKSIPTVAQNANEFSAKIGTTGTVTDENVDWISGDCTNATPSVCTFNETYENSLNCNVVIVNNSNAQNTCTVATESSNSVSFRCQNNSSLDITTGAEKRLICQKSGSDFKLPTVQPILVNQVTTNSGDPVKICRIRQTSGTSTAAFSSPDDCFGSGSRTNVGLTEVNFTSGYFKSGSNVDCSCLGVTSASNALQCGAYSLSSEGTILESETVSIAIDNGSGTSFDNGYHLICYGEQP